MLKIEGRTFMNIQEAVQWLLDNNCIPFQCTANYQANTEIGLGTIVNPSPAKVRIGSLIFFADSKVSTVVGITENGFICSDQYNNLVDDIAYVTNVAINASGHLITTLSDGQTIDAGIIKQVSGFSINASQHLIVTFNDGTTTDLGAIFNGNVNVAGNFTADSIIENMSGYSFEKTTAPANVTLNYAFAGVVKNGNKITFVWALEYTRTDVSSGDMNLGTFNMPLSVLAKLYPVKNTWLSMDKVYVADDYNSGKDLTALVAKSTLYNNISAYIYGLNTLDLNKTYYIRYEKTFLLSENLAS